MHDSADQLASKWARRHGSAPPHHDNHSSHKSPTPSPAKPLLDRPNKPAMQRRKLYAKPILKASAFLLFLMVRKYSCLKRILWAQCKLEGERFGGIHTLPCHLRDLASSRTTLITAFYSGQLPSRALKAQFSRLFKSALNFHPKIARLGGS